MKINYTIAPSQDTQLSCVLIEPNKGELICMDKDGNVLAQISIHRLISIEDGE